MGKWLASKYVLFMVWSYWMKFIFLNVIITLYQLYRLDSIKWKDMKELWMEDWRAMAAILRHLFGIYMEKLRMLA